MHRRAAAAGAGAAQSPTMTTWGHQVAKQWGGRAAQWNAASVTNDPGPGTNAQELYQTAIEDAVQRVVRDDGLPLRNFRLKHTAYLYPGTNVAKYVRIKIYRKGKYSGWNNKVVDIVTPDFAKYLAGGRAQIGTARRAFQLDVEARLRRSWWNSLKQKRGTDRREIRSWAPEAMASTDPR